MAIQEKTKNNNKVQAVFGGVIAVVLLLLYSSILVFMITQVVNCGTADERCGEAITKGMVYVVTMIGGLISALVIAQLAITPTGEMPFMKQFEESANMPPENQPRIGKVGITRLIIIYLSVWVLLGLAALVVGVIIYPDRSETISAIGNTWLGLAVAAGYSYFGIQPR
ncbi:MAG TPA: hypothetical protein ENJ33_03715 [Thiothrix sp.]|nr:hypothetical protein [Thiothrix sp.]